MKIRNIFLFVCLSSSFLVLVFSCNREEIQKDPSARLAFSTDTLTFDTIFTSFGSTTRNFRIYNPYNKTLRISSIELLGGTSSHFQLNVDGLQAVKVENLDILPYDSMYVFVQVYIDPNATNAPLLVEDHLEFRTNGNVQNVTLEAWGQDVHFINGEVIASQTWTGDKPYLIYNWMEVDSGQTLTLEEGTRVFMHRGTDVVISGNLVANGTLEKPVILQGDRLEQDYEDIPGQWNALAFSPSSDSNYLRFTTIKNGVVIQLGAVDDTRQVKLNMENCKILNMTFAGIYAFGAKITGVNLVAANAGNMLMGLLRGGTYKFYHSTFYNQGVFFSGRSLPSIVMSNYAADEDNQLYYGALTDSYFGNCIIWGTLEDEIGFASDSSGGEMNYFFDHCLLRLRSADIDITNKAHYDSIWYLSVPKFRDVDKWNFELDTLSFAKDKGSVSLGQMFPLDFNGKSRVDDAKPDLGAYERIEKISGKK